MSKPTLIKLTLIAACLSLAGCATRYNEPAPTTVIMPAPKAVAEGDNIGGYLRKGMDKFDKDKLSRALDKAPGKSTTWENKSSNITYTVTPIKVVSIGGNPYCREYKVIAESNGNKQVSSGTACVTDGAWKSL